MSKPAFIWNPDVASKRKIKPDVHQTKFGDGYELRVTTGVNFKPKVWDLQFTKNVSEAQNILTFLDTQGGVTSFTWVDPMNEQNTYVCREWSHSQTMFGVYQVVATFEQVFEY